MAEAPTADDDMKIPRVSKDSIIPISVGLLGLMVAGVWFLAFHVSALNNRILALENQVSWRWNFLMMREFAEKLQSKNPDLDVPDPQLIREVHHRY